MVLRAQICQASIISYKGPKDAAPALYFSHPYSTTARENGTILASDGVRPTPCRPSRKLCLEKKKSKAKIERRSKFNSIFAFSASLTCFDLLPLPQTPARASRDRSTWAFRAHSATLGWRAAWLGRRMGRTARWPTRPALQCA